MLLSSSGRRVLSFSSSGVACSGGGGWKVVDCKKCESSSSWWMWLRTNSTANFHHHNLRTKSNALLEIRDGSQPPSSASSYSSSSSSSFSGCPIRISEEVRHAVETHGPVVALESAIITHGMPYPHNIQTAINLQKILREQGVTPATVGVIKGQLTVGLSDQEMETLGSSVQQRDQNQAAGVKTIKVSRRDLPFALSQKLNGGTTVSGTIIGAVRAKIPIFVTGGLGGVHRGAESTYDISADLREMGRSPITVVSAGVKSILDIGKTLEYLETEGVCVCVLKKKTKKEEEKDGIHLSSKFPSFFTAESPFNAPYTVANEMEAANLIHSSLQFGLGSGILIAVPIPEEYAASGEKIEAAIQTALEKARGCKIIGKDMTPFLLGEIAVLTGGSSLEANTRLVENNARVGGQIALHLSSRLLTAKNDDDPANNDDGGHDENRRHEKKTQQKQQQQADDYDDRLGRSLSKRVEECSRSRSKSKNSSPLIHTTEPYLRGRESEREEKWGESHLSKTMAMTNIPRDTTRNTTTTSSSSGSSTANSKGGSLFNGASSWSSLKCDGPWNSSSLESSDRHHHHHCRDGAKDEEEKTKDSQPIHHHHFFSSRRVSVSASSSAEKEKRPVVIGGSSLDLILRVEEPDIVSDGRTHRAKIGTVPGGVGRNMAEALAKLGHDPLFISVVGNDLFGRELLSTMSRDKLDCSGVMTLTPEKDGGTAIYSALLNGRGECLFGLGDMVAHSQISSTLVEKHGAEIGDASIVLMDGNIPTETMTTILRLCQQHSIPVFYEPTEVRKAKKILQVPRELWPCLRYISPNLRELISIIGCVEAESKAEGEATLPLTTTTNHERIHDNLSPTVNKAVVVDDDDDGQKEGRRDGNETGTEGNEMIPLSDLISRFFSIFSGLKIILLTNGSRGFYVIQRKEENVQVEVEAAAGDDGGGGGAAGGGGERELPSFTVLNFPAPEILPENLKSVSGAGDCLNAGFVSGLLSRLPVQDCGVRGTLCAKKSLESTFNVPHSFELSSSSSSSSS